jgi:hypothetical protein
MGFLYDNGLYWVESLQVGLMSCTCQPIPKLPNLFIKKSLPLYFDWIYTDQQVKMHFARTQVQPTLNKLRRLGFGLASLICIHNLRIPSLKMQ